MLVEFYIIYFLLLIIILPLVLILTGNSSINTYGQKANIPLLELQEVELSNHDVVPVGIKYANVSSLWKAGFKGQNIKVGIIDSGVHSQHKEFVNTVIHQRNKIPDTFNGSNIHGTHVAGTIASGGLKIMGASPKSIIYDYRIFSNENSKGKAKKMNGDIGLLVSSLDQAYSDGCLIINLSLGIPTDYAPIRNAIHKAYNRGITIVAAAGNRERKEDNTSYPAMYDCVISVGALKIDGKNIFKAGFSMDNSKVDIWAHGQKVLSTLPHQKYGNLSGTSMASPLVAGTIASYFSYLKSNGETPTPQKAIAFLKKHSAVAGSTRVLKLKDLEVEWKV